MLLKVLLFHLRCTRLLFAFCLRDHRILTNHHLILKEIASAICQWPKQMHQMLMILLHQETAAIIEASRGNTRVKVEYFLKIETTGNFKSC